MGYKVLAESSDADLVERSRAGSQDAFAELYRRHAGAARMAISDNVRDPERQRDVLQEVFMKALARLESLRDPENFRPWVLQIARNASIDDLRSRLSKPTDTIDDDDDFRELAATDVGPDEQAELQHLAVAIERGVAALSSRDAAALSMAVHLGFGPDEIASALDISYGNAKVVLHRARRRLRVALEQEAVLSAAGGAE